MATAQEALQAVQELKVKVDALPSVIQAKINAVLAAAGVDPAVQAAIDQIFTVAHDAAASADAAAAAAA